MPFNADRQRGRIGRSDRERLLGQQGCVVWLTGLPGSGKSTIARALESRLHTEGHLVCVLDGDSVRQGLNSDLGFSVLDRRENIRRVAEVAALMVDLGVIVVTALIAPFRDDRDGARGAIGADRFVETFVDAPLATCEGRDPKGLYRKARAGLIAEFTGVSSPYEPPHAPDLTLQTAARSVDECVEAVWQELSRRGILLGDAVRAQPPGNAVAVRASS